MFSFLLALLSIGHMSQSFLLKTPIRPAKYISPLSAKKSSKQTTKTSNTKNKKLSTAGFGGAAIAPCPCGSDTGYMKCCGRLHKDPKDYADASAEQVVRARYSAYAKREVDFIVGYTHPLNKNYISDIEHWKETIRTNCYDNFELTSCEILSETYESDAEGANQVAKVKFVAKMTQVDSREKTAFMETSTFERAGKHIAKGAWLYKEGIIEPAPGMPEALNLDEELKKEEMSKGRDENRSP
jgi:SEC-C motif-containing protein